MKTLVKSQAASLIASAVDFTVTFVMTEFAWLWYGGASIAGNVSGAVVNFLINRQWVFKVIEERKRNQAWKYACVWFGYIGLSTLFVVGLTNFSH